MQMAATFNRPGNREVKLKLAFKIQAFSDPKKITKGGENSTRQALLHPSTAQPSNDALPPSFADLKKYYELIARNGNIDTPVPKKDRKEVISKVRMKKSEDRAASRTFKIRR
jgi:hypothetical protein